MVFELNFYFIGVLRFIVAAHQGGEVLYRGLVDAVQLLSIAVEDRIENNMLMTLLGKGLNHLLTDLDDVVYLALAHCRTI
jgi:hypothetical protein